MSELCPQGESSGMKSVTATRHPSRSKKLKDFLNETLLFRNNGRLRAAIVSVFPHSSENPPPAAESSVPQKIFLLCSKFSPSIVSDTRAQKEVFPVQRSQAREQEEFSALYRRHVKLVYQICLLMLKNVPDAEDAAQTVFRKALENHPQFRDTEHEKAWLIVTARNECRDQLKHWWRSRRADTKELEQAVWQPPEDSGVWEQVAALPSRDRLVLYLFYYQGYSTNEIAQLLEEKPSTLRCQLTRARQNLKLRLEAEGYGSK